MKRRLIRTLALMSLLSVVLPFQVTPTEGGTSNPFFMRILDEQGQGIPNIRVVSDNGIVCRTRADGSVRWTERSVMNRDVWFRLDFADGRRTIKLHPTAGGRADVSLADDGKSRVGISVSLLRTLHHSTEPFLD